MPRRFDSIRSALHSIGPFETNNDQRIPTKESVFQTWTSLVAQTTSKCWNLVTPLRPFYDSAMLTKKVSTGRAR